MSRPTAPCFQWEVIPGSYKLHYYYNPKTYVMQWSKPTDAVVCKVSARRLAVKVVRKRLSRS